MGGGGRRGSVGIDLKKIKNKNIFFVPEKKKFLIGFDFTILFHVLID